MFRDERYSSSNELESPSRHYSIAELHNLQHQKELDRDITKEIGTRDKEHAY